MNESTTPNTSRPRSNRRRKGDAPVEAPTEAKTEVEAKTETETKAKLPKRVGPQHVTPEPVEIKPATSAPAPVAEHVTPEPVETKPATSAPVADAKHKTTSRARPEREPEDPKDLIFPTATEIFERCIGRHAVRHAVPPKLIDQLNSTFMGLLLAHGSPENVVARFYGLLDSYHRLAKTDAPTGYFEEATIEWLGGHAPENAEIVATAMNAYIPSAAPRVRQMVAKHIFANMREKRETSMQVHVDDIACLANAFIKVAKTLGMRLNEGIEAEIANGWLDGYQPHLDEAVRRAIVRAQTKGSKLASGLVQAHVVAD